MDAQADYKPSRNTCRGKRERAPVPLRAIELGIAYRPAHFLYRHRVRVCRKCGQQRLVCEDVDAARETLGSIRDAANRIGGEDVGAAIARGTHAKIDVAL